VAAAAAGEVEDPATRDQRRPARDPAGWSQAPVLQLPLPLPALLAAPFPGPL
jgi:hypothetical protein